MTCTCTGCWRSTDSSIIYELCRMDINAAISLWGTWPFEPLLTNCAIHPQTVMLSCSFRDCSCGEYCMCQGSWSRPDPSRLLCAFPFFALFYEDLKSVSKQLSEPPEASPKKWKEVMSCVLLGNTNPSPHKLPLN